MYTLFNVSTVSFKEASERSPLHQSFLKNKNTQQCTRDAQHHINQIMVSRIDSRPPDTDHNHRKQRYQPLFAAVHNRVGQSHHHIGGMERGHCCIKKYAEQKKADWILNGGIEKEWDSYLKKMDQYGLSDYLSIKQKYFDEYQKSLSEEK